MPSYYIMRDGLPVYSGAYPIEVCDRAEAIRTALDLMRQTGIPHGHEPLVRCGCCDVFKTLCRCAFVWRLKPRPDSGEVFSCIEHGSELCGTCRTYAWRNGSPCNCADAANVNGTPSEHDAPDATAAREAKAPQ